MEDMEIGDGDGLILGWGVIEIGWVFRDFVLGFKLYTQTACIYQGWF